MSTSKPSVVLVHGAFHPPACYEPLTRELEAAGFKVVAPRLPSLGQAASGVSFDDDVAMVHRAAAPLFAAGKRVILVAHSYGSFLATVAAKDQTVEDRKAKGLGAGGFAAIVYLAGTLVGKGQITAHATNPLMAEIMELDTATNTLSVKIGEEATVSIFYSAAPQDEIDKCLKLLEPHCAAVFAMPAPVVPADLLVPLTYVVCEKDNAVLLTWQERILAKTPKMKAVRLPDSGHSPFLSHPKRLVEVVEEVASELAGV